MSTASTAVPASPTILRPPQPGDYGWSIERHGALYAQEYGWNLEFEALVASLIGNFAKQHDDKCERMWIATLDGVRVGSAFIVRNVDDPQAAQLRCLIVDPAARGRGVGQALVDAALEFARGAKYRRMVLWTNSILNAARHIYEVRGFRLVREEPHHSFGHELVGQYWALEFA